MKERERERERDGRKRNVREKNCCVRCVDMCLFETHKNTHRHNYVQSTIDNGIEDNSIIPKKNGA